MNGKRFWHKKYLRPEILIPFFIFFYLVFLIRGDLVKYFELKNEKKFLKKSIISEQKLKKTYLQKLARLDQPAYLEKIAREKLGFVKKGETGYKIY